jgi:hypothetical protein
MFWPISRTNRRKILKIGYIDDFLNMVQGSSVTPSDKISGKSFPGLTSQPRIRTCASAASTRIEHLYLPAIERGRLRAREESDFGAGSAGLGVGGWCVNLDLPRVRHQLFFFFFFFELVIVRSQ